MAEIDLAPIAKYIGELYAGACKDHREADPSWVDICGQSVKGWRDGYREGCKDMAEGVAGNLPEASREDFKRLVGEAYMALEK